MDYIFLGAQGDCSKINPKTNPETLINSWKQHYSSIASINSVNSYINY